MGVEAIVVEDDKLQKAVDKAVEQADNQMPAFSEEEGMDLDSLEVTGGEEARTTRSHAMMLKTPRSCASSTS